ncbi:MAG TPA: hypothetical protein PLB55_23650, partial [Prosthecobacter sp.]|nr:hypothetical protein [Prosthecobacter sp.]
ALAVTVHPSGEVVVLLVVAAIGSVSSSDQCHDFAADVRHSNIASIQLFLDGDQVVTVAGFLCEEAGLMV